MPRYKMVSGIRVQFTAEEETARDAEEAQAVIDTQVKIETEAARLARRTSAKAKLEALGLTTDEIRDTFNL